MRVQRLEPFLSRATPSDWAVAVLLVLSAFTPALAQSDDLGALDR
jgi:hypothetical protein